MRKFLIPLAAAVSTVAFAAPASAQWFPQPQPQPQGYGYGYHNNYGHYGNGYGVARHFQARIDRAQQQISMMASRGMISRRDARWLHGEAREAERLIGRYSPGGIGGREIYSLERNIGLVEHRVAQAGRRTYQGYGNGYGYGNPYGSPYGQGSGYGYGGYGGYGY